MSNPNLEDADFQHELADDQRSDAACRAAEAARDEIAHAAWIKAKKELNLMVQIESYQVIALAGAIDAVFGNNRKGA
jgi:hypothetical protein